MAEDHETRGSSRFGRDSQTREELHAVQERIRAACAAQRERAGMMRQEAAELRAQSRSLHLPPDRGAACWSSASDNSVSAGADRRGAAGWIR